MGLQHGFAARAQALWEAELCNGAVQVSPESLWVYIATTGNGSNEDLSDSMKRYTRVLSELPCTCLKLSLRWV